MNDAGRVDLVEENAPPVAWYSERGEPDGTIDQGSGSRRARAGRIASAAVHAQQPSRVNETSPRSPPADSHGVRANELIREAFEYVHAYFSRKYAGRIDSELELPMNSRMNRS